MTFINYASGRSLQDRILRPRLCGKTPTAVLLIRQLPRPRQTDPSRHRDGSNTCFRFYALELGTVRGFKTRFHLYTVPGQVFYDASRKLILKGVDGVVFVADSQEERMDANIESLYNLEENLKTQGYDLMKLPYVLQLNKRDLPNMIPVEDLAAELQKKGEPVVEAVASSGAGVFDTLKAVAKQVLTELRKG